MNKHNNNREEDIMIVNKVMNSSAYLNAQAKAIEAFEENCNISFVAAKEAARRFAEELSTESLVMLKASLYGMSAEQLTYFTHYLRGKIADRLIEDVAKHLEAVTGSDSELVRALLHLHDMLTTDDSFGAMPGMSEYEIPPSDFAGAFQTEFERAIEKCTTDADASALYTRAQSAIREHPEEKAMLESSVMAKLCDVILVKGMPLIIAKLTGEDANRFRIYAHLMSTMPQEIPIAIHALDFDGDDIRAVLPSGIPFAQTAEEVLQGVKSLITGYSTLSPVYVSIQIMHVFRLTCRRVVLELMSTATCYDIPLDETLRCKADMLQYGITGNPASEVQLEVSSGKLHELLGLVYGLVLAADPDDANAMLRELLDELRYYSGLEEAIIDVLTASLANYVIAELGAAIEDEGYEIPEATKARIRLYYAMRFAMTTGELAFWNTDAYRTLMV